GQIGHRPRKEADRVNIRKHIELIDRMPSHYSRATSTKEYITGELNLRKLYNLYVSWCHEKSMSPSKQSLYGEVFRTEYNISFHHPKKDQCELCARYSNSNAKQRMEIQQKYDDHLRN